MEWFEYIIIVVAVFLLVLPFILAIIRKRQGKSCCSCECLNKGSCSSCPFKRIQENIKKDKTQKII